MGEFKLYCPDENLIFPIPLLYRLSLETERTFKARVTPLKSFVRYQYSGETLKEVEADDYSLQQDFDPADGDTFAWYRIEFLAEVAERFPPISTVPAIHEEGDIIPVGINTSYPGVTLNSINPVKVQPNYNVEFEYVSNAGNICRKRTTQVSIFSLHPLSSGKRCRTEEAGSSASNPAIRNISGATLVEDTSRTPTVCHNIDNSCKFSIFSCGQEVFSKEEDFCPSVELSSCHLDEQEEVSIKLNKHDSIIVVEGKVNTLPPLISLLWANMGRVIRGLLFDPQILIDIAKEALGNPEECLLIMKINDFNVIDTVVQFCSTCSCDVPQYETECLSLDCPDGTCKVDCDDHYCCYNDQGISNRIRN